ncbi:hypothetical protein DXA13_11335 [Clostridium sp. AM58-1XD]|nr:hypothetical protein DXA13_11335 [Clostridium sp. AM58-1XD]
MSCLHVKKFISGLLHGAKPVTEMERSGIEVTARRKKPVRAKKGQSGEADAPQRSVGCATSTEKNIVHNQEEKSGG